MVQLSVATTAAVVAFSRAAWNVSDRPPVRVIGPKESLTVLPEAEADDNVGVGIDAAVTCCSAWSVVVNIASATPAPKKVSTTNASAMMTKRACVESFMGFAPRSGSR
jgi:hypothetical protein